MQLSKHSNRRMFYLTAVVLYQRPTLLTQIDFSPTMDKMDKQAHGQWSVEWYHLSMLGLMLIHVSKRGPGRLFRKASLITPTTLNSSPPGAAYTRQWIRSAVFQIMACRLFSAKPFQTNVVLLSFGPLWTNLSEI